MEYEGLTPSSTMRFDQILDESTHDLSTTYKYHPIVESMREKTGQDLQRESLHECTM